MTIQNERSFPPLHPEQLRFLQFDFAYLSLAYELMVAYFPYLTGGSPPVPIVGLPDHSAFSRYPPISFDNLECLRAMNVPIPPEILFELIGTSVQAGKLRELDIYFPDSAHLWWGRDFCAEEYLKMLAWLEDTPSIRTLGLFNFNFDYNNTILTGTDSPRRGRWDQAELTAQFVEKFPNLETVELYSQFCGDNHPDFITAIRAIIMQGRVKVIYQRSVLGVLLSDLTDFAASYGVILRWGTRPREEWPIPPAQ
jgi:hypothetical protein